MTNGSQCPASTQGDKIFSYFGGSGAETALRSALEVMDDDLGNEDGFCNSSEQCYFTPHIGAYQGGFGAFTKQCTFVNGTLAGAVTDVKMYGW